MLHLPLRSGRRAAVALTSLSLLVSFGLASAAAADETTPPSTPSSTPSSTSSGPAADGAGASTPSPAPSDPATTPTDTPSDAASATPTPSPSASTPAPAPSTNEGRTASVPRPPGSYSPRNGVLFNYPYSGLTEADRMRTYVYGVVQSVPYGGSIRLALYSLNDNKLVDALLRAKARHVSVQVIVNEHNVHGYKDHASSPPFIRLMRALGSSAGAHGGLGWDRVSWAKYCHNSCRGRGGNVHYKMMLFSSAGGRDGHATKFVTMMGSPNLTMLAARGQWNHLQTYIDNRDEHPVFSTYAHMFREMSQDKQAHPMYRNYCGDVVDGADPNVAGCTKGSTYCGSTGSNYGRLCADQAAKLAFPTYFFPNPSSHGSTDPVTQALDSVACTNVADGYGRNGRTMIRIGMYAWFDGRGEYLAKKVRGLWNKGCDIMVETAVMGGSVKSTLYNPGGRGRIPIRYVGTYAKDGTTLTYDHAKYLVISGHQMNRTGAIRIITGTSNWTALNIYSDDSTQTYVGDNYRSMFGAYVANFNRVWRGPHAFAPGSGPVTANGAGGRVVLGQGTLRLMDED